MNFDKKIILGMLCATASRANVVTWASIVCPLSVSPSFVKPVYAETVKRINAKFLGKATCPTYLQSIFLFFKISFFFTVNDVVFFCFFPFY